MSILNPRRNTLHRSHGFSLIEAMIAFLILAVGLLGITRLQLFVSTGSSSSQQRTQAVQLAQDKIACFRAWPSSCAASYAAIAASGSAEDIAPAGSGAVFHRSWTVTPHTNPTYKDLTVTVTWDNREGTGSGNETREVSLFTKISDVPTMAAVTPGGSPSLPPPTPITECPYTCKCAYIRQNKNSPWVLESANEGPCCASSCSSASCSSVDDKVDNCTVTSACKAACNS